MTTDITKIQKKAKCSMIVWTLAYLFLFPFLFFIFAPIIGIFYANQSLLIRFLSIMDILPILSMPLSSFLMWYSYSKSYYYITRICWLIPLFLFAVTLLLHIVSRL